jgi:hypothetical protein
MVVRRLAEHFSCLVLQGIFLSFTTDLPVWPEKSFLFATPQHLASLSFEFPAHIPPAIQHGNLASKILQDQLQPNCHLV